MIKYIVLSDLHAGGLTSMLRNLSGEGAGENAVTGALATALQAFVGEMASTSGERPQLILLGDVLDLQFSKRCEATGDALAFLSALAGTDCLAKDVIATAGNHDHSIWADGRLMLEAEAFANGQDDAVTSMTPAFHTTPDADSRLLSRLVEKAGFGDVDLRYPNIGFANEERAVLLHHGHYIESEYRLMSSLKDALNHRAGPTSVETLTGENCAWIDFAWSPFNDADKLELLYQNFLTTVGFRRITKKFAAQASAALAESLPMPGNAQVRSIVDVAVKVGIEMAMDRARDTERMAEVISLTEGGMKGLRWYLEGPVLGQIRKERPGAAKDLTFVLGHTHRPFSLRTRVDGYDQPVRVHNTGGWTLNGPRLDNAEGAAMVLIDDQLNVASLRLFSTPRNGKMIPTHIDALLDGSPGQAAFVDALRQAVERTSDQWADLNAAARLAYLERQEMLLAVTSGDMEAAQ